MAYNTIGVSGAKEVDVFHIIIIVWEVIIIFLMVGVGASPYPHH